MEVASAGLNLETIVVVVVVNSEEFPASYSIELFNIFLGIFDGKHLSIFVETLVFNNFVELSIAQYNMDVEVAHLRHLDGLSDECARALALQINSLGLVFDEVFSLCKFLDVLLHCPFDIGF